MECECQSRNATSSSALPLCFRIRYLPCVGCLRPVRFVTPSWLFFEKRLTFWQRSISSDLYDNINEVEPGIRSSVESRSLTHPPKTLIDSPPLQPPSNFFAHRSSEPRVALQLLDASLQLNSNGGGQVMRSCSFSLRQPTIVGLCHYLGLILISRLHWNPPFRISSLLLPILPRSSWSSSRRCSSALHFVPSNPSVRIRNDCFTVLLHYTVYTPPSPPRIMQVGSCRWSASILYPRIRLSELRLVGEGQLMNGRGHLVRVCLKSDL